MRTDLFDFELPEERIALHPASPRDAARLLVVRPDAAFEDRVVRELPQLLRPGDALVFNDTRVIPAALHGVRRRGGLEAQISVTLIERRDQSHWRALARPAKRLKEGDRLHFGHSGTACLAGVLDATVAARGAEGEVELAFDLAGPDLDAAIASVGEMPLPPYIAARRPAEEIDRRDYQTVYAAHDGAVAAPTAGLHFTPEMLAEIEQRGVVRIEITLHVGLGTFQPVRSENVEEHSMHPERYQISPQAAMELAGARRTVAVGTSCVRTLEHAVRHGAGSVAAGCGETSLFIYPGFEFRVVEAMLTNFHLPESTLLMLVSAFAGRELILGAYAHAVREKYRFFSYGDCMLVV
jgi:S-adenosylmethionine:tRNA ribosyltransferase-isomerase